MPVSSWSTSASSNTTVGGVAIAPGMARANVDDALRAVMAEAKAGFVEGLSVKSYGALGNGIADDTDAIAAAITAAKTTAYQEKIVVFPPGDYRVSQINIRDCNFVTLHATGTVNITGIDDALGWIIGDDRLDDFGHTETFTGNFRMTGGPWLIAPLAGENYSRALKLQNIKDSVFENLSVSGTYAPRGSGAGADDRIAVELDLSFNNQFYNCSFSYAGAPIGAAKSYGLYIGGDNANNNRFFGFRHAGGGGTIANTIGVHVESSGNSFHGADISAVHTCFELSAARGAVLSNTYHEAVSRVANVIFASTGCVFLPSYVDIIANGTAYQLGGLMWNVVKGTASNPTATAGDAFSINGTTVTLSGTTITTAASDIIAAAIANITAYATGGILTIVNTAGGAVTLANVTGTPLTTFGLASAAANASGTIQTVGFRIVGGNHKFTGSGTTGIKKGSNCYGLTYQPGYDTSLLPATGVTGTDRGSGGGTYFDGFETFAAKINFPDTPVPSSNATTLDAYKEQDLTNFGISVGATAQTATSAVKVTKIGRTVTITGYVLMGAAVSGTGSLTITGLPYAASGIAPVALSVANLTYTGTPSGYVNGSAIELYGTTEAGTRAALTHANLAATSEIDFAVTYTATA